jgi:hypothetical protein
MVYVIASDYIGSFVKLCASDWELRKIMAANTRNSDFSHNFSHLKYLDKKEIAGVNHPKKGSRQLLTVHVTTKISAGMGANGPQFHQHNKHCTTTICR